MLKLLNAKKFAKMLKLKMLAMLRLNLQLLNASYAKESWEVGLKLLNAS